MEVKCAEQTDAGMIHKIMVEAFTEYQDQLPPSSALEETPQSILEDLKNNGKALISFMNNAPSGMVRYQLEENSLYFYRLSVVPGKRGNGIAKKMLYLLEEIAIENAATTIFCKVRVSVPENIQLYQSMGYKIYDKAFVQKSDGIQIKVATMMKRLI